MKKHLPILLAALGLAQQAPASTPGPGRPWLALEAPAAIKLVELDLTPYGAPLLLQVPEGTTAKRSEYENIWVSGPDFALTINEGDNSILTPAQSMAESKSMTMMEGSNNTVLIDQPLVFRAHNSNPDIDDSFTVIVNDPAAAKHYIIVTGTRPDNGIEPWGAANLNVMFEAARGAHLTPAALAAKPKPPKPAPAPAVRNAAGETDLSAFGLPVLLKVPAGTRVEVVDGYGGGNVVLLNSPDFAVRVMARKPRPEDQKERAMMVEQMRKSGYTVTVNEPNALMVKPKTGDSMWMVSLPDPTHGTVYELDLHPPLGHRTAYGPVKTQAMYAAARAARLKK